MVNYELTLGRRRAGSAAMARKIRLECAGAVYHVLARGNQGRRIYGDDSDRKLWLETLGDFEAGVLLSRGVSVLTW
jgi:hypothetical protein